MKNTVFLKFLYDRRFFFGPFLFMLLLGFITDLKTKLDEFYTLIDQEKNFSLQWEEKEQALQQAGPVAERLRRFKNGKMQKPLLDQMIEAVKMSGSVLLDLQARSKNADKTSSLQKQEIKLSLYSDYAGFYQLLEILLRKGLPLQVEHFSLDTQDGQLLILLQFTAYPWAYWTTDHTEGKSSLKQPACCDRDPFQDVSDSNLERNDV